jgi:hypothetical protein
MAGRLADVEKIAEQVVLRVAVAEMMAEALRKGDTCLVRKGSHPRQERWSGFASESSLHSINQPGEHVPLLPPAGFHHQQQPLDKPAPRRRLRTKRQLPPNHRLTQRLLGGIVGRLGALYLYEGRISPSLLIMPNTAHAA